ncbi:hypothetical protein IEQ34_004953 [Dendrobium chrysotoxum]|uniref:Uncharacterized protein n=1 Tax=Dendrobium chrysotoxum TaxID=161865 RepID=A0AAV7GSJ2_DENCH|nr:hypothetical protein IEQ34_004953 [Dendrobium chrysotoxum]
MRFSVCFRRKRKESRFSACFRRKGNEFRGKDDGEALQSREEGQVRQEAVPHVGRVQQVLIALADNVRSNQLKNIRKGLRGDSIILMGNNTLIMRCIKTHAEKSGNQVYLSLLPLLVSF